MQHYSIIESIIIVYGDGLAMREELGFLAWIYLFLPTN